MEPLVRLVLLVLYLILKRLNVYPVLSKRGVITTEAVQKVVLMTVNAIFILPANIVILVKMVTLARIVWNVNLLTFL